MATGAKPVLDPSVEGQAETPNPADAKPLTLMGRIVRKLTEIFEYNERLGSTRQ
jgi:hypothetical protein